MSMVEDALNRNETGGTCLYASIMCCTLLNRFSGYQATIRGGDGEKDGGLFILNQGHGHFWVEIEINGCPYVADITGDQFGLDPVIFSKASELDALYRPGNQEAVNEQVEFMTDAIREGL